jgi:hypothetical protein
LAALAAVVAQQSALIIGVFQRLNVLGAYFGREENGDLLG